MSFNGIYNITLNGGSASANSAAIGSNPGVSLIAVNKSDPKQKWSIRPVGGAAANAYTIQSAYTGQWVIPNGSTLALTFDSSYVWIIAGSSGFISNNSSLNWLPSDNGQFVLLTGNTQWKWTIAA